MPAVKKNIRKKIEGPQKPRTTPLLLPRNPREAKKLAEINAMLEKAILLSHNGEREK